jgi:hypothetical protein
MCLFFLIFFGMFHLVGKVVYTFFLKGDNKRGFQSWKDSKSCLTFRLKRSGGFRRGLYLRLLFQQYRSIRGIELNLKDKNHLESTQLRAF